MRNVSGFTWKATNRIAGSLAESTRDLLASLPERIMEWRKTVLTREIKSIVNRAVQSKKR